jgi:4-hydroxy-tetrahydrodipicolinate synthase
MNPHQRLAGVYAAALTPLDQNGALAPEACPQLLAFLAGRGCHGALLHGTTGEGPSFAPDERIVMWKAALAVRQDWPDFRLLAGVGTTSLHESIQLTQAAFELGFDGVVSLPPFYYRAS